MATLAKIENFRNTGHDAAFTDLSPAFENTEPDDEEAFSDLLDESPSEEIGGKVRINLSDMDLPAWDHDLRADLAIIQALLNEMRKITPADDAKLQHLKSQILGKLSAPINTGNRKVIVFTAFADTANYLYDQLAAHLLKHEGVHSARVTGAETPKSTIGRGYDFQSILTLFSPLSKEKAALFPEETKEIDLLIATGCISEGQNLQDCDYLINYDIHWNPVRIIQRFGRIDRIGSKNACI